MNLQEVRENLEKKGYQARVFATKEEAAQYLNQEIDSTTVGMGGSVTTKELGLFESLGKHNTVWNHGEPSQVAEFGADEIRHREIDTEVYICSVNGMTEQGELVNIDGAGNRLGATCYGHDRLYYVIGKNKIAENLDQAIWRARNIAGPKNAQRLHRKTPCAVKADKCYDCQSPDRVCHGLLVMWMNMLGQKAEVLLVDEELGY